MQFAGTKTKWKNNARGKNTYNFFSSPLLDLKEDNRYCRDSIGGILPFKKTIINNTVIYFQSGCVYNKMDCIPSE